MSSTLTTATIAPDGTLPADFASQASNAWDNVKLLIKVEAWAAKPIDSGN